MTLRTRFTRKFIKTMDPHSPPDSGGGDGGGGNVGARASREVNSESCSVFSLKRITGLISDSNELSSFSSLAFSLLRKTEGVG
jgi:hypothetical protein